MVGNIAGVPWRVTATLGRMSDDAGDRTFEDLLAEGAAVHADGWDFSWFEGRATEERTSWRYVESLGGRLAGATAALDIRTGGGEVLDFALHRP